MIEGPPDLIKMEIEGAELSAIRGMTKLLGGERPPALIIEHNHETARAGGHSMGDLFREIKRIQERYRVYWIGTGLSEVRTAEGLEGIRRLGNLLVKVG
jgi:hypothetical protein